LPDINDEEYSKLFINKYWFDLLDIEHNFYQFDKLIIEVKKNGINDFKN